MINNTRENNLLQFTNSIIEYLFKERKGAGSFIRNKQKMTKGIDNLFIPDFIFKEIDNLIDGNVENMTIESLLFIVNKKFPDVSYSIEDILLVMTKIKEHDKSFDGLPTLLLNRIKT